MLFFLTFTHSQSLLTSGDQSQPFAALLLPKSGLTQLSGECALVLSIWLTIIIWAKGFSANISNLTIDTAKIASRNNDLSGISKIGPKTKANLCCSAVLRLILVSKRFQK
jgi:hypothetical protein